MINRLYTNDPASNSRFGQAWEGKPITAHDCESGYGLGAEAIGIAQKDGANLEFFPFLSHSEHPS
jgi:hypothetical protein